MAKFDEKDHIILLDERVELPEACNCITVEDDDTGLNDNDWPYIRLSASKGTLLSNGVDWGRIYADVRLPGGGLADAESRRDKVTPTDKRLIKTSYWITGRPRVFEAVGDEEGDEIPVESWSEREIITSTDMERIDHIVTYEGAETVSFSIDNHGDIFPEEVPAIGGKAKARLTARAGGGGYGVVTGTFQGMDDQIRITFSDPTVDRITGEFVPGNIELIETSKLIARVTAPGGNPVADGTPVYFSMKPGYESFGDLSAPMAYTETTEIEYEECWSTDEISISTYNPISELVSIKTEKSEFARDYVAGATFLDRQITLNQALPKVVTRVYVTYKSGGCASVTFVPAQKGEAWAECLAGMEDCAPSIVIGDPSKTSSRSSSGSGGEGTAGDWHYKEIKGAFLGSETQPRLTGKINLRKALIDDGCSVGPDRELEVRVEDEKNCQVDVDNDGSVTFWVNGKSKLVEKPYVGPDGYIWGQIYVQGKKKGKDELYPVPNHELEIIWSNYGEVTVPNLEETRDSTGDAISHFQYGRLGSHKVTVSAPNWPTQEVTLPISENDLADGPSRYNEIWEEVNYYALILFRVVPLI